VNNWISIAAGGATVTATLWLNLTGGPPPPAAALAPARDFAAVLADAPSDPRLAENTAPSGAARASGAATVPPWVAAEWVANGRIIVTGLLPDEATRGRLLAFAAEMHGRDVVKDSLTVDGTVASAAWLESPQLYATLAGYGQRRASFNGESLTLEGEVDSDQVRAQAVAQAQAQLGSGKRVVNLLQVRGAQAPARPRRVAP